MGGGRGRGDMRGGSRSRGLYDPLVWDVNDEEEGKHFPRGSSSLQTWRRQLCRQYMSAMLEWCGPSWGHLPPSLLPAVFSVGLILLVGTVSVLGPSQYSHDSSAFQLIQAWTCDPLSQWNLCHSFWEKRFSHYTTDLEPINLTVY